MSIENTFLGILLGILLLWALLTWGAWMSKLWRVIKIGVRFTVMVGGNLTAAEDLIMNMEKHSNETPWARLRRVEQIQRDLKKELERRPQEERK